MSPPTVITLQPATMDHWQAFWPGFRAVIEAQETYGYDPYWTEAQAYQTWNGYAPDEAP